MQFVMLDLDRPYKLRFGMGAVVEFQELTGVTLEQLESERTLEMLMMALWVMLRQDDPDLSWNDARKLVDEHAADLETIVTATSRAINISFKREKKTQSIAKRIKNLVRSGVSRLNLK